MRKLNRDTGVPNEPAGEGARDLDTRASPVRAMVLSPVLKDRGSASARNRTSQATDTRSEEARLSEATGLAEAIGLEIVNSGIVPINQVRPATLFGSGKVEELRGIAKAEDIDLVIVDHALTPGQQRNLERAWKVKVLDRTGIILEIFGERAQTREGRLQVELAHLTYQKSRLVRSWTHLERQRGGVGFLGGPGETQIEADRRALQDKINRIRKDLEQVRRTRTLHRDSRKRIPYSIVALVGYTNAGKSTLFNTLTGATVMAEDQVFATLDPTMRAIELSSGDPAILSDTVGFISNLPTSLVAAFRATLEEVQEANLILHVRDIASDETAAQKHDVEDVLEELGIEPESTETRILEVWNKIDLLADDEKQELHERAKLDGNAICVSAITGEGLEHFVKEIEARLNADNQKLSVTLKPQDGAAVSWLHDNARIMDKQVDDRGNTTMHVELTPRKREILERRFGEKLVKNEPASA